MFDFFQESPGYTRPNTSVWSVLWSFLLTFFSFVLSHFPSFAIRFSNQIFGIFLYLLLPHPPSAPFAHGPITRRCTRSLATARDRRSEKECPFPSGVAQADAEGSAAAAAVVSFGRPGIPQHHLEGQGDGLRPPAPR